MYFRRFGLFFALLIALLLVITACTPATTPEATQPAATQPEPTKPVATQPEPTQTEAAAPEQIVIGVYEPMTGAMAAGGELTMQGVEFAHKLKGEVLGAQVKLVLVDNRSDKAEAATAMTRLIEQEKAIAVIGSYGSSLSMAGGEVAEKAGIPVMGCSPTNPLVTEGKDYYFRACFIDPFQGRVMAKYAYEDLGVKR